MSNLTGKEYGVAPVDRRFRMWAVLQGGADAAGPTPPGLILVNNFFEELKRLVPN